MPSSQTYAPDGASKNNAQGQKNTISDPFTLNGNVYRTETVATLKDGKVISSEVKLQKQVTGRSGKTFTDTAITRNGGKDWVTPGSGRGTNENKPITTSNTNLTAQEIKELQPGGKLNKTSKESAKLAVKKNRGSDEQANAAATSTPQAPSPNKPDENSKSSVNEEDLKKEQASAQGRANYPDLKYPETLSAKQDCIQFKILKSEPRPLGATAGISGSRSKTSSRSGGSVTLPISGPVSDSNRVRYGEDSLTPAEAFFESLSRAAVTGGAAGAGTQLDAAGNTIKNNTGEIKTAVANEAVKAATGVSALTRRFGLVVNPNMELLFNGPELRSFSFTFRLTPRSETEAIIVRKIIRFFKQGMSAQRTKSQIYLSTPNSFEIQYLTGGKLHPYLPKIKECALTDCSVNYAPDGTYMTYSGDETSMTAYDLTLQFSELEPIFNDEYPDDNDATIGY